MAKITNVVNTVRVLTYIVLSLSFVLIESTPEGALVTQKKLMGRNCFITLSSPKQNPPVIQSSSGSMVALAALASMDSSMSTDAWDGSDEKEIAIQEIEHGGCSKGRTILQGFSKHSQETCV
ncbi:hypothetical protein LOK49_LG05G03279 [Camellia lanceoleosa]|uniref:Uncharacterized protein n=1 Tax=Camellia lanceoleosa TaxID=1840588 RepID=A0ACC0HQ64_9ERIC|nr:hypothetical protein LOK49_LG05G03279 [Camellia lanceoleosa]